MIGIVILNYNTLEETKKCVKSIIENEKDMSDKKIYVVDNASTDGSGVRLGSLYKGTDISFVQSEKNLGFSGGNNLGIKEAIKDGCEYIFLLNSDIELLNNAITLMTTYFAEHNELGTVGPYILDRNGEYSQVARRGLKLIDLFLPKLRIEKYNENEPYIFNGMSYGCCFAMRADFIKSNNLLDDRLFLCCEEDALAYTMKEDKLLAGILPSAKVRHFEGASTGEQSSEKVARGRYYRWESELYVLKEYAHCSKLQLGIVKAYRNITIMILRIICPGCYDRYI